MELGNGVVAALPGVASRLLAHAIVEGPGTNELAAIGSMTGAVLDINGASYVR